MFVDACCWYLLSDEMKGYNTLLRVLTFAKLECVLQPEPWRAWPNIKTQETNVISSLLYTYNILNCPVLAFSKKRKKLRFIHKL